MWNLLGQPVTRWMDRWSFQAGYPLVVVDLKPLTGGGTDVFVSQRPFYLDEGTECNESNSWWIPIKYRFKVHILRTVPYSTTPVLCCGCEVRGLIV